MLSMIRGRDKGTQYFGWGCIQHNSEVQTFDLQGEPPTLVPLVGYPDLPIRETLRSVLGLLTVMILKRWSENIFFQSNKFIACKINDGKELANSLKCSIY